VELELLKAVARQRLAAEQGCSTWAWIRLHLAGRSRSPVREWAACSMPCPVPMTCSAWARAAGGDEVFRGLVLARIIEPVSKLDSLPVLEEAGADAASYRTLLRRLPAYATAAFRQELSAACAAHARPDPASLAV
jgi:hypothetical protein